MLVNITYLIILFVLVYVGEYGNPEASSTNLPFNVTQVKKIDGDIFKFRKDLDKFLFERLVIIKLISCFS